MKLAFCLFKYFPFGGMQRDFLRIAEECVKRGHTVDIYTMKWEGELPPAFNIHLISISAWQNHTRAKKFAAKLKKIFKQLHYDLIIGFNKMPGLNVYYAADTCYQAKAKKQHGFWYRFTPRYRHLIQFEKSVFAANAETKILLLSKQQQKEFEDYYGTTKERFYLLPPGISKDRIAPFNATEIRKALRQEYQINDDEFLLLMVGSGFKTKGLDRILLGISSLPAALKKRVHCFVIGKDHAETFQQQASHLQISQQIRFLGGRDDVPRFLLAADVLLHPAYNENTGTVLLEAIVSGLPVLTTDVCGYAGYVQLAKAGIVLSSPFQQTAFNKTLENMLLSDDRHSWQANGLAFAKTADIYRMPEAAVNMIESQR